MASLTVVFGFYAVLCCLQLLEAATKAQASQLGLVRLAATAFVPLVVATLVLAPLLLFAHVRALGRAGGGEAAGGRRLVAGLSKATVLAAAMALVAGAVVLLGADGAVVQLGADGAVVQLGADGHLDRGRGDVARLNVK